MRSERRATTGMCRLGAPLVLAAIVACGDSSTPAAPTTTSTIPQPSNVDPALVGTWVGPIEGGDGSSHAEGTITMVLNRDGSMSATIDNPRFHPINDGTWSVSGNDFDARGPDVVGTLVIFTAPRSTTELNGTWDAGRAMGTFVITKQ